MTSPRERLARELHYKSSIMDPQHSPMSLRAHNPKILSAFLNDGVDLRLRLSGHSMKPLLRTGSVLCFSGMATPQVGDIVLLSFANGGHDKLVAHRVVGMNTEYVWTQGDSSTTCDPPVSHARVLGTAVALEIRGIALPLQNAPMRAIGLHLSAVYPGLVRVYRTLVPRKVELHCAS